MYLHPTSFHTARLFSHCSVSQPSVSLHNPAAGSVTTAHEQAGFYVTVQIADPTNTPNVCLNIAAPAINGQRYAYSVSVMILTLQICPD